MSRKPKWLFQNGGVSERWMVSGICVFLAAIVWLVFGQTARFPFINYDDDLQVYAVPQITGGLTWHGVAWAFQHRPSDYWHPLDFLSHMLDCQLFGLWPGGHHLTNVLLHAVVAALLFLVLRQMTGALWRSAFVAAIFAIHPLRVESVAWIAERKDILHGLFFVLTIGAYVRYVRNSWSLPRYLLVIILFALGLMSKPTLMPLPFVLLLLDYWPLKRFDIPSKGTGVDQTNPRGRPQWLPTFIRLFVEKIPLLLLSAASCLEALLGNTKALAETSTLTFGLKITNALVSYVDYVRQMFFPVGLAVLYPFPVNGLPVWEVLHSLLVLVFVTAGLVIVRRRYPYALMGWLWYIVMLLPMIGIVQATMAARADRYTYLPQIGLYLAVTWSVADLSARWKYRRLLLGSLMAATVSALAVCAFIQTTYWQNSETLWKHTLACTSRNAIAHTKLANFLNEQGRLNEATDQYLEALKIQPDDALDNNNLALILQKEGRFDEALACYQTAVKTDLRFFDAHYNFGNFLRQRGRLDEAIVQYGQALEIDPDYADAQNNLGNALLQKGRVDEAMVHYRKTLGIHPTDVQAHFNLANALQQKGKFGEAIAHYRQALQIQPDYADAHNNLAVALLQAGQMREAITHFQQVLKLQPGNIQTANNLAYILATSGNGALRNGPKAIELAQRANQLAGGNQPIILLTLAAAYAETGKFPEAMETAQKALQLSNQQGNSRLSETIQSNLRLYQAGQPLRDSP